MTVTGQQLAAAVPVPNTAEPAGEERTTSERIRTEATTTERTSTERTRTERVRTEAGFDTVAFAVSQLAAGRAVLVVDDEDPDNEGDLVFAAESATAEMVAFTVRHSSGLLSVPMTGADCDRLGLPPMYHAHSDRRAAASTVSVDARTGISTGISAHDRARTIRLLAGPDTAPDDLTRPGHVLPLRARDGGVPSPVARRTASPGPRDPFAALPSPRIEETGARGAPPGPGGRGLRRRVPQSHLAPELRHAATGLADTAAPMAADAAASALSRYQASRLAAQSVVDHPDGHRSDDQGEPS